MRILILFLIVITLPSCYNENKEKISVPEKLLTKDQMTDILTEFQLAEGILTVKRIENTSVTNSGEALYSKVIAEHKITRQQLQENIDYYNGDPKLMETIYEEVLARLSKMQSELIIQAAKFDSIQTYKRDSIQKHDSAMHFQFVNLVLIQEKDSLQKTADSVVCWKYKENLKVPGFIY